jgi:signal transduction histidine kinase
MLPARPFALPFAARERGGTVRFQPSVQMFVQAGPLGLHRALTNLVDNALRYGGNAEVGVRQMGGRAVVEIRDEGPGLAPDLFERVQEPFFRAEPSRSSATGGTGLGLAIAKDVVVRNHGELVLRNGDGGGLAVEMRLPLPDTL